jgi:hypothetical protein
MDDKYMDGKVYTDDVVSYFVVVSDCSNKLL